MEFGYFDLEIVLIEIISWKGIQVLVSDEGICSDIIVESLGKLCLVFVKDGVLIVGNCSQIIDGVVVLFLVSGEVVEKY